MPTFSHHVDSCLTKAGKVHGSIEYIVFEAHSANFDMQPDDIKISDTVEFI